MSEQGLGLQISFEPDRQLKHFLKDLPPRLGNSFEPGDVHATIIYPEEVARAGLGDHEQRKLLQAVREVGEGIYDLIHEEDSQLEGRQLKVAPDVLRPYKKFFGIEIIDEDGTCDSLRSIGTKAIENATGIRLRSYLPTYHMSVARRNKGDGRRKPMTYTRHFPTHLTISGINTGIRTVRPSNCGDECYVNDVTKRDPNRLYS